MRRDSDEVSAAESQQNVSVSEPFVLHYQPVVLLECQFYGILGVQHIVEIKGSFTHYQTYLCNEYFCKVICLLKKFQSMQHPLIDHFSAHTLHMLKFSFLLKLKLPALKKVISKYA